MLNNRGVGSKEYIIMFCIILFCMLMIGFYYDMLKESVDGNSSSWSTSVRTNTKSKDDNKQNVDVTLYKEYEKKMGAAALKYVDHYEYKITNEGLRVDVLTLIKFGFLEAIRDSVDKSECGGYVLVDSTRNTRSYLNCSNYKTNG